MPSTVQHYKLALSESLRALGVEIKIPDFSKLMKAMEIERPRRPSTNPQWSLNTVLRYIDELQEPLSELQLLRKASFLLLLATGYRISELHACEREGDFCRFLENGSLSIRPRSGFLAKNEHPKRPWGTKVVKPLILPDGKISNLCPVATLRKYLDFSKSRKGRDMFLPPSEEYKSLTIKKLSYHICSLIVEADPDTKARVKDVRAYAASFSLEQTMLLGQLIHEIGWSSAVMFFKHYCVPVETLDRAVALPVRVQQGQH